MELVLIRHFKTAGNLERRYIGKTDEALETAALPEQSKTELFVKSYSHVEQVIVSPMKRCVQTAEILFPGRDFWLCDAFREMDFGNFERKNYEELRGDPDYQRWLDSVGTIPFPGGEDPEQFQRRCREGFRSVAAGLKKKNCRSAAMVVHGGTIMAILSAFSEERKDFYHWQVKNGSGFLAAWEEQSSPPGEIRLTDIRLLTID